MSEQGVPVATATIDDQGRAEPPLSGSETDILLGFLEFHRATFAWKCSGLDSEGLNATIPSSEMTLGGMMKHLAGVEDYWVAERLRGLEAQPVWAETDWASDPDWDWNSAVHDSPAELRALWEASVGRSRELTSAALREGDLDQPAAQRSEGQDGPTLRWILVHLIEEYSRHNGHADLIREAIDGQRGE